MLSICCLSIINPIQCTQAFQDAVAVLLTRGSNHSLSNGIIDLGGAILDLSGGDYLISAPVIIPNNYGNFQITGGLCISFHYS